MVIDRLARYVFSATVTLIVLLEFTATEIDLGKLCIGQVVSECVAYDHRISVVASFALVGVDRRILTACLCGGDDLVRVTDSSLYGSAGLTGVSRGTAQICVPIVVARGIGVVIDVCRAAHATLVRCISLIRARGRYYGIGVYVSGGREHLGLCLGTMCTRVLNFYGSCTDGLGDIL